MSRPARSASLRWIIACAVALAAPCRAEDPPPANAGTTPAEQAATPVAPAAVAAPPPLRDIDRLATALVEEHRRLEASGEPFPVFVRAAVARPVKGAVILVPGDGEYPTADAALAQLREHLPSFGWSTWLIGLQRPPRIHALAATTPAAGTATEPALEQQRTGELAQWAQQSQARIAATVTAASKEGPVVVIAQGVAAPLLTAYATAAPATTHAVALIEPLALPGLRDDWPKAYATPVLEILGAPTQRQQATERRERASAAELAHYRQMRLAEPGEGPQSGEPALVRRVRGWLLSLER